MWLYTEKGFYSIVADHNQPTKYVWVRARAKQDIETASFVMDEPFIHLPDADYPWRMKVPHHKFAEFAATAARAIDYTNYKNRVATHDRDRAALYGEVWGVMARGLECGWYGAPLPSLGTPIVDYFGDTMTPVDEESLNAESFARRFGMGYDARETRLEFVAAMAEDYAVDFDGGETETGLLDLLTDLALYASHVGVDAEYLFSRALAAAGEELTDATVPETTSQEML